MDGFLIDDNRSGNWIEYYHKDHSQVIRKSYFQNGLRQGTDTIFRDNKIAIVSNWLDGIRNGTCQEFRHNYLYSEVNFLNGISTTYLRYFDSQGEVTDSVNLKLL